MKKRFIFIPLAILIVIAGVLIWACELRHPFGMGLSAELLEGLGPYMSESGGPGYKGDISAQTTNTYITKSTKVMVFPLKEGNNYYRIPTLVQLTNGDLLAFADKRIGSIGDLPNTIEVVYKRSKDNGRTWSAQKLVSPKCTSIENSYGDAAFILDRKTGNIICVVASGPGFKQSTPNKPIRISVIKSKNNGETWEQPVDITSQIYGSACKEPVRKTWHAAFTSSGNGVQLRNGRMLFVLNVRENSEWNAKLFRNYVMYSDDGGDTWNVSKNYPVHSDGSGGNEAKIVELNDGTLLMAARPGGVFQRYLAKSTDNGETWGTAEPRKDLPSSSSNGDIIYYTSTNNGWDKNRLITMFDTVPYSVSPPAKPYLFYSYDDGNTWRKIMIENGQAGYSSLAILNDGSIGILAEIGGAWNGPIYFMRLNMKYITGGKDSGPFKVKVKQK
jgi:sialidase-1